MPAQTNPAHALLNQRHPNLAPDFLAALAQALGRPVTLPHGLPEGVTPEGVLAYVYAVLHAPSYRSRYAGFLKSDFPRIPLSNQALTLVNSAQAAIDFESTWLAILPLGQQLIDLHLLKNVPTSVRVRFAVQGSNEVEKPRFEVCNGSGRVWINASQYFDGVPFDTWGFKVGGYQVCEKWLKDRKGRQLDFPGPGAGLGVDIRDGFNLALKHSGGKFGGLPVEVIVADDQGKPDAAKQAADRLVKHDQVDFMTGVVFSNVMLAVGKPIFDAKNFYISANAGPSQYAGAQCNPYFFSASYQNDNLHEAVGKTVQDKGFKKVALLAPNYPAGKDALAGFKRYFKGEIASETYTSKVRPLPVKAT